MLNAFVLCGIFGVITHYYHSIRCFVGFAWRMLFIFCFRWLLRRLALFTWCSILVCSVFVSTSCYALQFSQTISCCFHSHSWSTLHERWEFLHHIDPQRHMKHYFHAYFRASLRVNNDKFRISPAWSGDFSDLLLTKIRCEPPRGGGAQSLDRIPQILRNIVGVDKAGFDTKILPRGYVAWAGGAEKSKLDPELFYYSRTMKRKAAGFTKIWDRGDKGGHFHRDTRVHTFVLGAGAQWVRFCREIGEKLCWMNGVE